MITSPVPPHREHTLTLTVCPKNVLELRIAKQVEPFLAAIRERLHREPILPDPGRVRLELLSEEIAGEVIEQLLSIARTTGTTILAVNSTARQLEDAYLKLITEDEFRGFLRVNAS